MALVTLAQYGEALPLMQDFAARRPNELDAHYLLGAVYRGLGQFEQAEIELERAVGMDANHYDVRYNLGFVLAKLGKPQQALPHLEKALELHPDPRKRAFNSPVCCALSTSRIARSRNSASLNPKNSRAFRKMSPR